MIKVLITDIIDSAAKEKLQKKLQAEIIEWDRPERPTISQLNELLKQVDAAITMVSDPINEETLAGASKLKIISNYAVGFNNININYLKKNSIIATNTPNVLHHTTAELTLALMFSVARQIQQSSEFAKSGNWTKWMPTQFLGMDLSNKTLGIFGAGQIGFEVARRCFHGLRMEILYTSRKTKHEWERELEAKKVDLKTLLSKSDVISLHANLNEETTNIINSQTLKYMKNTAIIINTARGEMIETSALVDALKNNLIFAAALDVTNPEPLDKSHELYTLSNCLITPHIGSATLETRKRMAIMCADDIISAFTSKDIKNRIC